MTIFGTSSSSAPPGRRASAGASAAAAREKNDDEDPYHDQDQRPPFPRHRDVLLFRFDSFHQPCPATAGPYALRSTERRTGRTASAGSPTGGGAGTAPTGLEQRDAHPGGSATTGRASLLRTVGETLVRLENLMARFAPVFVKRHRKNPPLPFRNTEPFQDILHQAPFRQPGLEQVEPDESREKKPVSAYVQAKNKACQDKGSCDHPDPSFNVHRFFLPLAGIFPHSRRRSLLRKSRLKI